MPLSNVMQGARLEFVARQIKGSVTQRLTKWDAKKKHLVHTPVEVKDAYMVYLPTGHSYRLTYKQLVDQGFDRKPTIMNFERVNKPDTPAGRFKFAINDEERRKAWHDLENEVIRLCERKQGKASISMEDNKEMEYDEASA